MLTLSPVKEEIKVVEVGPRDGLQNEKVTIPLDDKVSYIHDLLKSGIKDIEVTSFVNPKKIPQMADAKQLYRRLNEEVLPLFPQANLIALVPNLKGLDSAREVGCHSIALFTATSDQFNLKNINSTVEDSLVAMDKLATQARQQKMTIRGYISTVFGCPYQGETSLSQLIEIIDRFLSWGVEEISLGDTIGIAHPIQVDQVLTKLKEKFSLSNLAMHFHDTRGLALPNILVSLGHGIRTFDSSSGGLGGCPYAHGATGNVATEDLLMLLQHMAPATKIDMQQVAQASKQIYSILNRGPNSKALNFLLRNS